ncbi:MAG: zinc-dependent alcohol dehydrogenase [Limnochordia bacterium]
MKALVYHGPNDLRYEDIETPKPGPGDLLIAVKAVGICGSDVHGYQGITGRRTPPMVMGHEFSGVVAEVGSEVSKVSVGQRVAIQPFLFCGECEPCKRRDTNKCKEGRLLGVLSTNGAMAEYVVVPEKHAFPLADDVSFEEGALVEAAAVALRAINRLQMERLPEKVAIVGVGTIGLLLMQYARLRGAKEVLVTDLQNDRLALAREMGADLAVNPKEEDLAKIVDEWTGGEGVPLTIEAVGATPTVQQGMSMTAPGGTVLWVGNSQRFVEVNMQQTVTEELRIIGTFIYSHDEFGQAVEDIGAGRVSVKKLVSATYPLAEGPEVFAALAAGTNKSLRAVLTL